MRTLSTPILCLLLILTVGSSSSFAHHSFASTFDASRKVVIEGVVTEFSFRNPHILVYLDVTGDDGQVTRWVSEGAAANLYRRANWTDQTIKPGDVIQVTGSATHDGSPMTSIDFINMLDADTRMVVARLDQSAAQQLETPKAADMPLTLSSGQPNLTGYWTNHGVVGGRPNAGVVPFNETGAAVQQGFDLANDAQVFCDPPGLMRQALTPHPLRITQHEDRVVIQYEEYAGHREIFFDDRAHLGVPTHMGDSIARYDGDALIIETTQLLTNTINPEGNALSAEARVVETYRRTDTDRYGPMVSIEVVAIDPLYLTENLVVNATKMSAGQYSFIENDCHAPLRERTLVHPAVNLFMADSPGEGSDAFCQALAASVGADSKTWRAASGASLQSFGNGPWYNARGVLAQLGASELTDVSLQGQVIEGGSGGYYCVAPN